MGGVDKSNAFIGNYTCVHKIFNWTVKVVMLLNIITKQPAMNAFILYHKIYPTYPNKMRFMNFKMEVIERTVTRARLTEDNMFEHPITGQQFLEDIPSTKKKQNPQKRCVECTKRGTQKKARINVKIVLIIQVCAPHYVLRHTTNEKYFLIKMD